MLRRTEMTGGSQSLLGAGALVLRTASPRGKISVTRGAWAEYVAGKVGLGGDRDVGMQDRAGCSGRASLAPPPGRPARPELPRVVGGRWTPSPKEAERDLGVGPAAFCLHSLAHIELNAVDLAWDSAVRWGVVGASSGRGAFASASTPAGSGPGLPPPRVAAERELEGAAARVLSDEAARREFVEDFARTADDEARHLGMCMDRLEELGAPYGVLDSHDELWRCAEVTRHSLAARLAVVPMVQEARGLDAGPRHVKRLEGIPDDASAAIVAQIVREEEAHVQVGVKWFRVVCAEAGVDPAETFRELCLAYAPKRALMEPFNEPARERVGLAREWYSGLGALGALGTPAHS